MRAPSSSPPPGAADAITRELARLVQSAVGEVPGASARPGDEPAPLRVPAAAAATAPKRLAAAPGAGPQRRRESLELYSRCLRHYRATIQPQVTHLRGDDDLGAAAATFVLANLAALHGHEPDETLLPVIAAQLTRLIQRTEAWQRAALADRQSLFEQLALLGVLVNESRLQARAQGPAAQANLQRAARAYLLQFPGFDPNRLLLTPRGLAATASVLH
jgi:hypothetical protein